jgi:hypothetical protein
MFNSLGDDALATAMRTLVKTEVAPSMTYTKTPTDLLAAPREVASRTQLVNKAWPMSPALAEFRPIFVAPTPSPCRDR